MNARKIAMLGILTAVALILGYLESLLAISPVPGVKLGLANTVLLYALYLLDAKSGLVLMLLKVLLSGLLFSGAFAMLYSFVGGTLSLAAMLLARRILGVGVVGVSVCGAVMHNVGQLIVACMIVQTQAALSLLPLLLASAALTGTVTGLVARLAIRGLAVQGQKEAIAQPVCHPANTMDLCGQGRSKHNEPNTTEVSK